MNSVSLKKNIKSQRWVIKAGSNIICSGGLLLLRSWMHQVSILKKNYNIDVIWVTSGAIASAIDRIGLRKRKRLLPEKQALSAIGQPIIMDHYNLAIQANGLVGAQILLTYGDLDSNQRLVNFINTVEKLLEWGVVPVLNENDAIATEEIKFGDNDTLSARVAHCLEADRLVILTDVLGFYNSDPRVNPKARLVKKIKKVSDELLMRAAEQVESERGSGGIFSKLRAANYASQNFIETWLVKGDLPQALLQVYENKPIGTVVEAQKRSKQKDAVRSKNGIATQTDAQGRILSWKNQSSFRV
jgi:glutamate 5-kinase